MTNNKQQTAVDSIIELCQELLTNHYSISHDGVCSEIIRFCQEQAKEMEKQMMIEFAEQVFRNRYNEVYQSLTKVATDTFNETYGGGEE